LAEHLIKLYNDENLYNEYLEWKKIGPSKKFIALVDRAIVHSNCRLCIKAADLIRIENNNIIGHEKLKIKVNKIGIKVRERGKFWLRYVYIPKNEKIDLEKLKKIIKKRFEKEGIFKNDVYSIYYLSDNNRVEFENNSFNSFNLKENDELEFIFEDIFSPERGDYSVWKLKNKKRN
jgi:hypothetical protein